MLPAKQQSSEKSSALSTHTSAVDDAAKLVIRYKEGQVRNMLFIVLVLAPVWAIWCTYVALGIFKELLFAGFVGHATSFGMLGLYLFCIGLGSFTVFVCLDNKFEISPDGIELPWQFLADANFLRVRPWRDLIEAHFRSDDVVLKFTTPFESCQVKIKMDGLRNSDVKNLVQAIRSNSPGTNCNFDRNAIETGLPGSRQKADDENFTAVWERDLASRFGSTAFVPLEANTKLMDGRITVLGQVSFGGLSAIYVAKDELGAQVVLKEAVIPLNADETSKAKALEMFQREASILKGLSHPNIARVLDHFVEQGRHYLLLEHLNGLDLRAYVREHGTQSQRVVMRWALEISDVLAYLHEQTPIIIHRDVTPDNLMLDRTGSIKLIDFGAANTFIGAATGTLVGKQAYISPEQFRGKAVPQSDIYSLGCTLYYLTTGRDPEALSQSSLPEEIRQKCPVVNELIEQCTEMELNQRIKSMRDISQKARHFLQTATNN